MEGTLQSVFWSPRWIVLRGSSFELSMTGLHRLVRSNHGQFTPIVDRPLVGPGSLAAAILKLASISAGSTLRADITGPIDLCWLAAFSEWALKLDVAIFSAEEDLIYRSRNQIQGDAQAVFWLSSETMNPAALTVRGLTLINDAQDLFQPTRQSDRTLLRLTSTWNTILHDTFGDALTRLVPSVDEELSRTHQVFAFMLSHIAETIDLSERICRTVMPSIRLSRLYRESNSLSWVQRMLPELRTLRYIGLEEMQQQIPAGHPDVEKGDISLKKALKFCSSQVKSACCVATSAHFERPGHFEKPDHFIAKNHLKLVTQDDSHQGVYCIEHMAFTIIFYIHMLCFVEISEDVLPSVYGLQFLYAEHGVINGYPLLLLLSRTLTGNATFAGDRFRDEHEYSWSAEAANGTCISVGGLIEPKCSFDRLILAKLMPGDITYNATRYNCIQDLNGIHHTRQGPFRLQYWMHESSLDLKHKTVIADTDDERILILAHRFQMRSPSDLLSSLWSSPGKVYRTFTTPSRVDLTALQCQSTREKHRFQISEEAQIEYSKVRSLFYQTCANHDFVLHDCDFSPATKHAKSVWKDTLPVNMRGYWLCDATMISADLGNLWLIYENLLSGVLKSSDMDEMFSMDPKSPSVMKPQTGIFGRPDRHALLKDQVWAFARVPMDFDCFLQHICLKGKNHEGPVNVIKGIESIILKDPGGRIAALRLSMLVDCTDWAHPRDLSILYKV